MDPEVPLEAEIVEDDDNADKARDGARNDARRTDPPPRRVRAALIAASGQAKSRGQAMIEAGYSQATAKNPSQNKLTVDAITTIAAKYGDHGEVSLKKLAKTAIRKLARDLEDDNLPPGIRMQTSLAVAKLAQDEPTEPGEDKATERSRELVHDEYAAVPVFLTARAVDRYGFQEGLRRLSRASKLAVRWRSGEGRIGGFSVPPRVQAEDLELIDERLERALAGQQLRPSAWDRLQTNLSSHTAEDGWRPPPR